MKEIKSPSVGEAGNVAVIVVEFVFKKYPSFAVALKFAVLIACHAAPPDTVAKDKLFEPSVTKTWFAVPDVVGKFNV